MEGANLQAADFRQAFLIGANLKGTYLGGVDLTQAGLSQADLSGAILNATVFGENYLDDVRGLDSVIHGGPSIIGIETIYLSKGNIPEGFLRGCGLPDEFITRIPSLVGALQPIQFYSCFISYSHKDEEFATCLYSRMREANLRVWYAPEEMQGGKKLHEQIYSAIKVQDKLLLVLSENSLKSEWVATEIRRARKAEREENRRKLFPIRLVDFDAERGKDLGIELMEYFIPDFSNWKDQDSFEKAFERLLRDLKAEAVGK